MQKTISVLLVTSLLLVSCGGRQGCQERVFTGKVGICLRDGWEQVPDEDLRAEGVPEETIAAFQTKEPRAGQRDNIVVSRERIASGSSAKEYSTANIAIVDKTPEYVVIEKRDVEVDDQKTILHIFSARPVPDLPSRRFYQISLVDGNRGYVFTGTLPLTSDDGVGKAMEEMMVSVSLGQE